EEQVYLSEQGDKINSANILFSIASFAVFIISAGIIINNYQITRKRELEHSKQLRMAENKAATDNLTGTKNRHAYSVKEDMIDAQIAEGSIEAFAVIVCDVNDLKTVNDKQGHHFGDRTIKLTCEIICRIFKHSPVFRIGGDEFVVILENEDYENRAELMEQLERQSAQSGQTVGSTFSAGISEYRKGTDESLLKVFTRADEMMYMKKVSMKKAWNKE
ncbi:MAG: GGDEF domain-containing protein, partial [Clostridia bacterium]|nr:GGDEF domain-containing protein [Clostridia bacterium]